MSDDHRPRVLLVGAYERDNFGDLLFLIQTENYLTGADVTAAAPFPSDMSTLLDRKIPAFGKLLESEQFDHIWTVGGEVGATSFMTAFRMSVPPAILKTYRAASHSEKKRIIDSVCGSTPIDSPYIPRPTAYPLNASASLTLNSVGFVGAPNVPRDRLETIMALVREADRISVRDDGSSEFFTAQGIEHTVAPDLVHTIALTRPRQRAPESDTVLVQVSDDHLKRHGYEAHAEALARSKSLAPYRIRFFIAGTAPGHDSAASYERLIAHMRKIAPEREIDISTARRPLDLVDEIASARLWIGLSLHGRIVSSAYDVPRISLTKRKLNSYSATWDPHMPYDVTPDRLDDAVAQALDPVTMKESAGIGLDLAHRAKHNIESAVSEMLGSDPDERTRRRFAQVERRRQHLAQELASRDTEIAVLRRELETTNSHLADLRQAPGALGRATYRGLNAVKNRLKKSD